MKILSRHNYRPADNRAYIYVVEIDTEVEHWYGPVENLQIAHGWLRDTADSEEVGEIDAAGDVFMFGYKECYGDLLLDWPRMEVQ